MRRISTQFFQQEGYFRNSSFNRMRMSSIQSDIKSIIESGRSSPSQFKPLAISWSRSSMPILGNRTKQRGSTPLTLQVLPFPSIIAALCADAKIRAIPNDTLISQEPPIVAEAMQQQDFSSSFYTHFDTSMSQIQRRLDQQHEENRRSFKAINTRMDRMDDQLSFLCYSNQMANEQMLSPYQNTARQFKEMEMQGIPVTMANLAIHRQREEANKGKAREIVPDSEDSEDTFVSGESEEF
ncbi:hypothetical protein PIB30_095206 [Stylosanthes scabra]|uniref:Uncharacterized protein n=1 Tax=Stylosanthes scabra TaxID=79078 RepID=A0ABU6UWE9_9FABA|nr:hypothetical protein [Stylosanthes scabra]